ncbi:uncharacterized protein [Clytia hemisphaerica]|uniref:uncharacterized protein n=1 Tax=Clytia hemisphaerica TaxID=252671 RepID=UPI0034D79B79
MDEVVNSSLANFIEATSTESTTFTECGICSEMVKEFEEMDVDCIPGRELLSQDSSDGVLPEYNNFDLILSAGGINGRSVVCCKSCLNCLRKNKKPPLSIANNFQFGETPSALTGLTLPEKLLISIYRPKMYVTTLRSFAGPGTAQNALRGNTITFPQDVVKIAENLPADPNILADHLKVVFIGKGSPSKEMLKKTLTVRREKVYDALTFLIANHPLYSNVAFSNVVLPRNDIPDVILNTLVEHEDSNGDDDKEHANYTPQTDINIPENVLPDQSGQNNVIVMDSSGVIDVSGSSVSTKDQMVSAVQSLEGALIIPHGPSPVTDYNNPALWMGAYPWLFPYGKGGPELQRTPAVSLKTYIRHLLSIADKRPTFHSSALDIDKVSHQDLVQVVQSVGKTNSITDPNLRTLMRTLTSAGANIRGSPYCKQGYRREIFGLMVKFGTPPLWITISPAVVHSPIFLRFAGHNINLESLTLSDLPAAVDRAKIVAKDPVAAARFFNSMIDSFTTHLLGYNQSAGGVFGHPSAFYGCIEEQGTGTLHIHMLVWLKGFRAISDLEADLKSETFKENLIKYLEATIKQGYIGNDVETIPDVDVSEISTKRPTDPSSDNFEKELADDVNKLVKVANTHRHSFTCYKYRKARECRFGFPRELQPETVITEDEILLKRTNTIINNFNPILMTSIRSNHDIKFIPSGKDGKSCVFYMTDYATKSQLSTHQMLPLIAASKKVVQASNTNSSVVERSKALITKCLNRITTETEISGSHVSHFLLGHTDKKTSHSFIRLNLHSCLAWIHDEMKKYDALDDDILTDVVDDEGNETASYSILSGNNGLVLVNQMVDYLNRGDELSCMPLYEYFSKVYKTTLSSNERRKLENHGPKRRGRKPQPRHLFAPSHPQSETHVQVTRTDSIVPSLSLLPPSEESNPEKFHICMLLLFKPFVEFTDLYNGISWEDYFLNTNFDSYSLFINNIKEMHVGLKEKEDNLQNGNKDNEEHPMEEDVDFSIEASDKDDG